MYHYTFKLMKRTEQGSIHFLKYSCKNTENSGVGTIYSSPPSYYYIVSDKD